MTTPAGQPTRILTRRDVQSLLDLARCIDAIENAFRLHAAGASVGPGVLGTHVPEGGFHVKAAGLIGPRSYYAAKVNANFPNNPHARRLPTIQGVITLFDMATGTPLAIMDSIEITSLRTAAASAAAAKFLSRAEASVLTIIGCGAQARSQARAMLAVRSITHIRAYDAVDDRATAFARELEPETGVPITAVTDYRRAVADSDIVVTCTPARSPLLWRGELPPGAFLAAVGADNPDKQELDPTLLAESVVVVDDLEQCAAIGELHHALDSGAMTRDDVRADLAAIVSGARLGRESPTDRVIFDSTGTALQDVAAAALVYERACARGVGLDLLLSSSS